MTTKWFLVLYLFWGNANPAVIGPFTMAAFCDMAGEKAIKNIATARDVKAFYLCIEVD